MAGQTGEIDVLLVEQHLQPRAVVAPAVIQHQGEVGDVGIHAAGAEGPVLLLGIVASGQRDAIVEEAKKGEEWREGFCMANQK